MIKKIFTLSFVLLIFQLSFSQKQIEDILPSENGNVIYSEVIEVNDINKDELYNRARKWVVLKYQSANNVIQLDDKLEGIIIGKGNFDIIYYSRDPKIRHTIQIETKDGRFKYTISGFVYSDKQGDSFAVEQFPKSWSGKEKLYRAIDEKVRLIIKDLTQGMNNKPEDNW